MTKKQPAPVKPGDVIGTVTLKSGRVLVFEEPYPEDIEYMERTKDEPTIPFEDVLKKYPDLLRKYRERR